jgi:anaphase-promoting complex subunit 3
LHEHDSAITAFKRAIQVDPYFTYAHTLMGHEYLSNEDMESAAQCFKAAVRIHHRHYNAMYLCTLIFPFIYFHVDLGLD